MSTAEASLQTCVFPMSVDAGDQYRVSDSRSKHSTNMALSPADS